jgi:hypothetical protein
MMTGIEERETGGKAMRRRTFRELRTMVITLSFFVAHAAHEDGAKEVFCMPAFCRDKVRL